jgi:hypothetical protein
VIGGGEGAAPASHLLYVGEVVDVGESTPSLVDDDILQMGDTRMNYGG